jgi:hypothetical protein
MFCPKCGVKNEDSATFCVSCGNQLSKTVQPSIVQPLNIPPPPGQKNPMIAAVLNFFFPGIGYWYWGYQKVATIPPLLLFIIVVAAEFVVWNFIFYAGILLLGISAFFAYDLYVKTTGQRGWIEASM